MGIKARREVGFTFVEVLIALVITALALGPLLFLLSKTNKESSGSLYKVMAAHYGNEILEQLLQWESAPGFAALCHACGADMKSFLECLNDDPFFNSTSTGGPKRLKLGGIPVYMLVSPLARAFSKREITVIPLSPDQSEFLFPGNFYQVKIRIEWTLDGDASSEKATRHNHEAVGFFRGPP